MKAIVVPVTRFQQNCSILCCERSGRAAVVDPGGDLARVLEEVDRAGVTLEKILITHAHADHAGAAAELSERLALPIEGPHLEDRFWVDALSQQGGYFGLPEARSFIPDRWLDDGDRVQFGLVELQVLHCPGHTPGHLVFFHAESRLAIVGDVLFRGSIGRTDFPRGDYAALIRSIRERLWPLGDDVRFIPGHGPGSTFGEERRSNPFVGDGV